MSKKESIAEVAAKTDSSIVLLNETLLSNKNKVQIPGYFSYSRGRKSRKGREISCSVRNNLKNQTVNVKEGIDEDEYMIVRLEHWEPPLCIVNCYGEQEGRMTKGYG